MDILAEWFVKWFFMMTGRLLVCIATLGHCRYEALLGDDQRIHGASGALWYTRDGRRIVTTTGQMLAGLAFYVAIVLALVGLSMG